MGGGVILMSEFCLDCWNKMMNTNDTEKKLILSKDLDLCEECGQYKRVVVAVRRRYIIQRNFLDWVDYLRRR